MLAPLYFLALTAIGEVQAARPLELGLGFRNAVGGLDDPAVLEGPRLVARLPAGPWAIEGSFFYRVHPSEYTWLAEWLSSISTYGGGDGPRQQAYRMDRWSGMLLADWSFGVRPEEARFTAAPHLYGGFEVKRERLMHGGWEGYEFAASQDDAATRAGPVAGVGLDLQAIQRLSMRLAWYARPSLDGDPDDAGASATLDWNPTLAVDLLVRL